MLALFLIVFFVFSRIGLASLWDQYSVYYSYLYELIFVVVIFFITKKKKIKYLNFELKKENLLRLVPWPLMGFGVYKLANFSGISIPFDFKSLELVFMLLVIAPVLEELIFRFALWELVDDLIQNKEIQIWISAILFSVGHLVTIFMISPDFRPFVLYQALYVIILSIGAAKMRQESKGITGSILVHFLFNFGFYLASLI